MNHRNFQKLLPIVAWLSMALSLPVGAASSAASSASDSVATSVGSLSGSVVQSSDSVSKDRKVADGDYRIIRIAEEKGNAQAVRLTLAHQGQPGQANADAPSFQLILPRRVVDQTGLAAGGTISARQRAYGLEFAEGQPRRAFFLALFDEWHRELQSAPVSL